MTPLEQAAVDFEKAGLEALAAADRWAEAQRVEQKAKRETFEARDRCEAARQRLLELAAPALPHGPVKASPNAPGAVAIGPLPLGDAPGARRIPVVEEGRGPLPHPGAPSP